MIKSLLKSYKERLSKELSTVSKTYSKKISRVTEQITEFDALEAQLLSWGLTKYIPSFKIQVRLPNKDIDILKYVFYRFVFYKRHVEYVCVCVIQN